jgi:uncharacterized membrane protein
MNASQVHLALTHMPVILTLAGICILLVSLIIKNKTVSKVSYFILVAAGIFAIPVFLSGEGAEEIVEEITGVTGSLIEEHEEIARFSLWAVLFTGLAAAVALFRLSPRIVKPISFIVLIAGLITAGLMFQTAHLGGQIRHTEIQKGSVATNNQDNEKGNNKEDDD